MSDYRLQKISTSFEVGAQELKAFKTKDPVLRQEILKQFHHKKQGPTKTQSISYLNHFCACRMCKKAPPKKASCPKKKTKNFEIIRMGGYLVNHIWRKTT